MKSGTRRSAINSNLPVVFIRKDLCGGGLSPNTAACRFTCRTAHFFVFPEGLPSHTTGNILEAYMVRKVESHKQQVATKANNGNLILQSHSSGIPVWQVVAISAINVLRMSVPAWNRRRRGFKHQDCDTAEVCREVVCSCGIDLIELLHQLPI